MVLLKKMDRRRFDRKYCFQCRERFGNRIIHFIIFISISDGYNFSSCLFYRLMWWHILGEDFFETQHTGYYIHKATTVLNHSSPSFFLKLFYNYCLVTVNYSNTSYLPLRQLQILLVFIVRNVMFSFSRALQFHVELMVKILQS